MEKSEFYSKTISFLITASFFFVGILSAVESMNYLKSKPNLLASLPFGSLYFIPVAIGFIVGIIFFIGALTMASLFAGLAGNVYRDIEKK